MKKSMFRFFVILVLFLLLLFPSLSFEGAKNGLLLWFQTVLPTLFPFMLCSSAIVAFGAIHMLTKPLTPVFSRLSLSEKGGYALLTGLLCGYPMGPKTAADLLKRKEISLKEAKYLLAISAWPSPMFLTGYVGTLLPSSVSFFKILVCVYLPLLPLAAAAKKIYHLSPKGKEKIEKEFIRSHLEDHPFPKKASFDELLMESLEIMAKIGGYIMVFSILAVFVRHLFPDGSCLCAYLLGFIEMTTGIQEISRSQSGLTAVLGMMGAAVFGGLSGVSQVAAVIQENPPSGAKNAGLSIRHYVLWKFVHLGLSTALLILLSSG